MNIDKMNINRSNWNKTYDQFRGWCALPTWGPYRIGEDQPSLIGDIEGKVFLEIACGSGHSVKYLLEHGAKKVFALDFSDRQLEESRKLLAGFGDKAELILTPMEEYIFLPELIDTAFSIYGIGWSLAPLKTFRNIYQYLKPGGRFIWSWDHKTFSDSKVYNGRIVFNGNYHDEFEKHYQPFYTGEDVFQTNWKTSTWFRLLIEAGFKINQYLEPPPRFFEEDISTASSKALGEYYHPLKARKLPSVIIFDCEKPKQ